MRTNEDRIKWLVAQPWLSFSIERDTHHVFYVRTVAEAMENQPELYHFTPEDDKQEMIRTNTMWELNVYPDTPNGSQGWYAATFERVVDMAMDGENIHLGERE